jgi:hypothetical protein
MVRIGPLLDNVVPASVIDLLQFPVPQWSDYDTCRYLGTWHLNISKDPGHGTAQCRRIPDAAPGCEAGNHQRIEGERPCPACRATRKPGGPSCPWRWRSARRKLWSSRPGAVPAPRVSMNSNWPVHCRQKPVETDPVWKPRSARERRDRCRGGSSIRRARGGRAVSRLRVEDRTPIPKPSSSKRRD